MRALSLALICILTFSSAGVAMASDMSDMKGMSPSPANGVKTGKGTGVVKTIDLAAGTVTIQHGPIPGVGWPAMTMTFKATPSGLLKGLHTGETIGFDARVRGASAEVTAVRPK